MRLVFITMDVWRIRRGQVPTALLRMATQRRPIRRAPGCTFAKLLGTGAGRTFTPHDADLLQWALLACWRTDEDAQASRTSPVICAWQRSSTGGFHALMRPLAAHGRWSRREPFGAPEPEPWDGPVAALTRARIKTRLSRKFWSSVPAVTESLHAQPGLIGAIGIGEAPVGLQGTFSVWRSSTAVRDFAYRSAPHLEAIRRTDETNWYAEELFARFAIISSTGELGVSSR